MRDCQTCRYYTKFHCLQAPDCTPIEHDMLRDGLAGKCDLHRPDPDPKTHTARRNNG